MAFQQAGNLAWMRFDAQDYRDAAGERFNEATSAQARGDYLAAHLSAGLAVECIGSVGLVSITTIAMIAHFFGYYSGHKLPKRIWMVVSHIAFSMYWGAFIDYAARIVFLRRRMISNAANIMIWLATAEFLLPQISYHKPILGSTTWRDNLGFQKLYVVWTWGILLSLFCPTGRRPES